MDTLTAPALRALARAAADTAAGRPPCTACAGLRCAGWEAQPSTFDGSRLRLVGTLVAEGRAPTFAEYHPAGTRYWSPDAPIAPGWHPYDRCQVWACAACGRPFLRYTEYGGYYVEPRIRELDAALVVDAGLPDPA